MNHKLIPIALNALFALPLLCDQAGASPRMQESDNAMHRIFLYDAKAELDARTAKEITALVMKGVAYKRPGRSNIQRLDLFRFHSVDFHDTPASVRVCSETIGRVSHAPVDEQVRAYQTSLSALDKDLPGAPNSMIKAVIALQKARLLLQWAGISAQASERTARADAGLEALAEILADDQSWFFIQGSHLAQQLHILKDDGRGAIEVAQKLVDTADALGDPGRMLVVQARLWLAQTAVAGKAGATARDAAAEGYKQAVANGKWFDGKTDAWAPPIVRQLELLANRCRVWEGFGILAQDSRGSDAREHFAKILREIPPVPSAKVQLDKKQAGSLSRVVNATDYGKGLWYGSSLWAGASLGLAEATLAEAGSNRGKLEEALKLLYEVTAVAPALPELLPRAKLRLGECIEKTRGAAGKKIATMFYTDVVRNHPTSSWSVIARSKLQ